MRAGRRWPAFVIPMTMLVWANVHGGFVVGLIAIAVYAALMRTRTDTRHVIGRRRGHVHQPVRPPLLDVSRTRVAASARGHHRVGPDVHRGQRALLRVPHPVRYRDRSDCRRMETTHCAGIDDARADGNRRVAASTACAVLWAGGPRVSRAVCRALVPAHATGRRPGGPRSPGGVRGSWNSCRRLRWNPWCRRVSIPSARSRRSTRPASKETSRCHSAGVATPCGGWRPRSRCRWTGVTRRRIRTRRLR